jgi:hypothetical protein
VLSTVQRDQDSDFQLTNFETVTWTTCVLSQLNLVLGSVRSKLKVQEAPGVETRSHVQGAFCCLNILIKNKIIMNTLAFL